MLTVPSPPANDNCANAATLTINADMNCGTVTSGTTLGATSSGVALGSCSGTADDDVWYKFVATSTAHTIQLKNIVSVGTASSTSLYAQVFSGDCATLTSTRCISSNTNFTYLSGLVAGQTYYVRVYNSESNSGASIYSNTFDICMGTLPSAPANDDCAAPVNLAVNGTLTCASPTSGTTFGATNSSVALGSCTGTPDDDVWYTFTAVGPDHTVLLSNVTSVGSSSSTSLYTQVFSGVCGTLTSIKCGTTNTTVANGLTPGALYYVRVYNSTANTATALYANTFNICIGTPPPPPANDNIAGALTLTVNPDYACGTVTPGTTESATASTPAPSCTAAGANDDVWFKFIAVNAAHRVSLANTSGSSDMNMVIYGADGTTELTSAMGGACANVSTKNLTGLTVGNTYFVRVYTNSSSSTTISSFTVCVGTPPPPPVNDNIASAINLAPSATGICSSSVTGTTTSATQSTGQTAPACSATGINDDVWYSFTATSTTHLVNVDYSDNATTTQVYSGASGSLVSVGCFDGGQGNSNVLLNSLTVGNTYYVRIYSTTNTVTTSSNFQICISTPVVPVNDLRAGAIALNACAGTTLNGNNALATDETLPASTCGETGSTANYKGVWFTVTPAVNGAVAVETCGSKYDTYLRIYTDNSGTLTCFSNTSGVGYDDDSCAESLYGSSKLTFNGVAGTTYYVLLTGYNASRIGEYSIKATQNCSSLATSEIVSNKTTEIKAYPNPFADILNISDIKDVKSIMISDMSGKIVRTIVKPESSLRLRDLNAGMYLVILNMNDGSRQTIKAIKK
ncbi:T9SS type A sorting domain-containing protein [Chryseobacterium sp. Leaf394]|uniref:T9SS type A sorting domain-containing protein n=1 Tax=Chryseobacterium sp. Leaf394 TaxID=1736361 RepID=UPI0012FF0F54|nr:T9SS type A sorting domain-containing protein [Chryseobacterium sp. Leaf394]